MYRIVVIDDEYIVVEGIKAIIKKRGMDCEVVGSATDGIDGLEVVREMKPDLVITDIRMPGMDGLSLIETAKEVLTKTRFIVISGFTEFEYAKRAISLGVKGYIDKPITIEKLEEVINKLKSEDESKGNEVSLLDASLSKMMDAIILQKSEELIKECENYLTQWKENGAWLDLYKKDSFRILCVLLEVFAEQKKSREDWMEVSFTKIDELKTVQEIKDYVFYRVKKIANSMETVKIGTNHYVVSRLLQYIADHYNRDIGLTELADEVNMNPSYLSILFKEEVGMSYVKYLTNLRMNKAKELLKAGYKVTDVSEMVGYNNYRYFCDIFKKHQGKTPNEYKGCIRRCNTIHMA
jgi:two-component system response regulator YesN